MTAEKLMNGIAWLAFGVGVAILASATVACSAAGWDSGDPAIIAWFKTAPVQTCCGEGDAYEADIYESAGEGVVAVVTDGVGYCRVTEDDETGGKTTYCKQTVPDGTKVPVPAELLRYAPANPTGHGVIFLRQGSLAPICYWLPSGV